MRRRRIHDERAKSVNSHRRGLEEKICSIWRLGGRAKGRLQTSRSLSTSADREDRGNAELGGEGLVWSLRRGNFGLEDR